MYHNHCYDVGGVNTTACVGWGQRKKMKDLGLKLHRLADKVEQYVMKQENGSTLDARYNALKMSRDLHMLASRVEEHETQGRLYD